MPEVAERKALSEEMDHLAENVKTMAELSSQAIHRAVENLTRGEKFVAEDVRTLDREIYGLKERVVESCVEIIALHAPVARDLRTITTSLEIATDLDRFGRYAKDIAEAGVEAARQSKGGVHPPSKLLEIGKRSTQLIDIALESLSSGNADPVRQIDREDDIVDRLHEEVFRDLIEAIENRRMAPALGAQYILINRYLERVADHAVNVGEWVVYLVTGTRPPRIPSPPAPSPSGAG